MTKGVTPEEAHGWLKEYFKGRPDFGLSKLLTNWALQPQNPFAPEAQRKARRGFVLAASLIAATLGWFAWFNLAR
jgi:hypothetical protein